MKSVFGFLLSLLLVNGVWAGEFVEFVIPHEMDADSPMAFANVPIRGQADRLVVKEGHFCRGNQRERLWGVNLSFAANFPRQEDAAAVAKRLAWAGVNTVRCHHMDSARWPRGLWNRRDGKTIEPEALDRLDYFINELAKQGIYVDLNLHVGREHSEYLGLPKLNHNYDKMSGIFVPQLIEAQKNFARQMLDRVNPYRKLKYADDPAVAIVEITNEDSLFMWSAAQTLPNLPEFYTKILQEQYNDWLQTRYGSTAQLRSTWSEGSEELGENILQNADFQKMDTNLGRPNDWNLEQHQGSVMNTAKVTFQGKESLGINITNTTGTNWHLQVNQGGIRVKKGKFYTIIFEAAAERPRTMGCGVSQAHEPWGGLGFSKEVKLTNEWKAYRYGFTATDDDDNARISFSLGKSKEKAYLRRVELRPGGRQGLLPGESLEAKSVKLYGELEAPTRVLDRMRFLAETEKKYFDAMRNYIKQDLGYNGLVTGTIEFGPLGLFGQSDMDFIDGHAYWQHPRFPNRPWDPGDWLIDQKAMSGYRDSATLFRLGAERLADKPYTVTEYNHPAPLDSQSECVPMIASFAAAQDWDGIWLYSYSHNNDSWGKRYFTSFFDIHANPSKWGFVRAGAAIFRQGDTKPLAHERQIRLQTKAVDIKKLARQYLGEPESMKKLPYEYSLTTLAQLHLQHNRDMFAVLEACGAVTQETMLKYRLAAVLPDQKASTRSTIVHQGGSTKLTWPAEKNQGVYAVESKGAWVYTGQAKEFVRLSRGKIMVQQPTFAAVTVTALDGKSFTESKKILITACGRCENQDMQFSADRRTLGRNWGEPPVQIEAVAGTISLPKGQWKCQALGPDGKAMQSVPLISDKLNQQSVTLSAKYNTMWYLLSRK